MSEATPEPFLYRARGYLLAALAVGLAAALRSALDPVLGAEAPVLIFVLPVFVAAVYRGLGPGLFATALGVIAADLLFLEPRGSFHPLGATDAVRVLLFVAQAIAISVIAEQVHRARRRTLAGEAALRESEAYYRAFFDLVAVGTAQLDAKTGRFLEVNDAFCRMTGYSREELLLRTFSDITHPEDRAADTERYRRLLDGTAQAYWTEKRYVRKDRGVIWVRVDAAAVRSPSGGMIRSVGIVQDITERKRAEAEAARQSEAADRKSVV